MDIFNSILSWALKKRIHDIELFMKYPEEVQQEHFFELIETARNTSFGKEYDFKSINSYQEFKERIPIRNYEELYPYIEKLLHGEQNILWPSKIKWFAKSSGTTNARSKFIPVSEEALNDCHFKGGKDLLSIYINNHPESKLFTGKSLTIGGSQQINTFDQQSETRYGDVSAVIMKNLPLWAQLVRTPNLKIALMDEWEEKIEKMAQATINENVTSLAGVPTWTLVLLNRILEITGKKDITEVWPNLELFAHGAVAFGPYRKLFRDLIPSDKMNYMESYNASEGYFGIQDQKDSDELLLMLDYGVFYEFVPMEEIDNDNPRAIGLGEVEVGKNYALIITTNSGLWRYKIGDTIRFTSTSPYRIKISGRTKHFINAFGEELVIENAEKGIEKACEATGAVIDNFTAGPIYLEGTQRGGHEYIIEFIKSPDDLQRFTRVLDETLRESNSDYDAKRHKDIALKEPSVHDVPRGTFYNWMKKRGKLGGQNKVPRLSNNRDYLDSILEMLNINAGT
ncbi:GH3 auxin-responsive promoter family protein [Mangrovivirga cuniculi]|uniref:GH3 auxin-responsive promoter n=1 Tax=Mangrovivirga cuniculi TaxID=2715131 RepID=A0A4D7JDJ4_9BACT|nr:GH3 auxin-responsive promoter family protein [Mangrovivirga cuniculi]QCK13741.1 hypothetical protein DCC35_02705 [Mangrovivirga cuniculi]